MNESEPLEMAFCKHPVNSERVTIKNETKATTLPELPVNLLRDNGRLVANIFINLRKHFAFKAKMSHIGFYKRSGTAVNGCSATLPENCCALRYRDG
jgi:hypothetical protein